MNLTKRRAAAAAAASPVGLTASRGNSRRLTTTRLGEISRAVDSAVRRVTVSVFARRGNAWAAWTQPSSSVGRRRKRSQLDHAARGRLTGIKRVTQIEIRRMSIASRR